MKKLQHSKNEEAMMQLRINVGVSDKKGILCNYLDCIWNMLTVELNDARKITIESEDILGKNLNPSLGLNVTLVQDQKTI